MASQSDYINKLRADVSDAEKQLQTLLEKREMYKSLIVKLDAEERSLSKKLQETKAKFRELSGDAAPAAPKSLAASGVVQDVSNFEPLANSIPVGVYAKESSCTPIGNTQTLAGPQTEDVYSISDVIAARTVSTYPLVPGGTKRQGSPICDQYFIQAQPERLFVCVADGCNWGERPREAARIAAKCFVTYTLEHFMASRDMRECGKMLLSAMKSAHNSIIANKADLWEAGTTTLVGGVVVPLKKHGSSEGQDHSNDEFGICLLSIGDCKCFLWEAATGKVRDITVDNRGNLLDPTDPGGRLGPTLAGGQPDTRNLTLFFEKCHQDDVLMLCSDGVHDNLDPSSLGVDPDQLTPEFAGMNWDEACKANYDLAATVKRNFSAQRLADLINGKGSRFMTEFGLVKPPESEEEVPLKGKDLVLTDVARDITEYCLRVTKSSRDFMENNARDKLPKDYKRYPGKMDHTTCVLVRARLSSLSPATVVTAPTPEASQPAAAAAASPAPAEAAAASTTPEAAPTESTAAAKPAEPAPAPAAKESAPAESAPASVPEQAPPATAAPAPAAAAPEQKTQ